MIFGLDADNAWAVMHSGDEQGIYYTGDGGESWERQESADYNLAGSFPNVVHFWDANNGFAQGDPVDGYYELYTTTDGGENWNRVPSENIPEPLSGEFGIVGYYWSYGDTIWWGTNRGRCYKSTDRGYNWEVYQTQFTTYCEQWFSNENHGICQNLGSGTSGEICRTLDGGETWEMVEPDGFVHWSDICPVRGQDLMYVSVGAATDASGASYTLDGGDTWIEWDEMWGIQLLAVDSAVSGDSYVLYAGTFNDDEFTNGVYKYIPPTDKPLLTIENVAGGLGVSAKIKNSGDAPATNVQWSITLDGIVFLGAETEDTIANIDIDGEESIKSGFPLGFGSVDISISATCDEGISVSKSAEGKLLLFFVTI
jgi:photosystem II stability/assembly factor-like uncharacterized protein